MKFLVLVYDSQAFRAILPSVSTYTDFFMGHTHTHTIKERITIRQCRTGQQMKWTEARKQLLFNSE